MAEKLAEKNKSMNPRKFFHRPDRWTVAALAFTLTYAAVLSVYLGSAAIHWDEINHLNGALLLLRGQIWDYAAINSFYPPLYNMAVTGYFAAAGASVFMARLVSLTFTALAILLIFKFAKDLYGPKTAFVSAVLFAVMPGIVWLSGLAMIEAMLIFAFTFSLVFFFRWLQTNSKLDLAVSAVALVLGVFVKYQTLVVAPVIMVVCLLVYGRTPEIGGAIKNFVHSKRLWLGVALAVLAAVLLYAFYTYGILQAWLYALQVGNTGQTEYSTRFPLPIFYLIEVTWPYSNIHPISLWLYILGLAGLAFFAIRRKPQDKYLLIWFIATYVIFSVIPNKQWRYVTLLFPAVAISAAELTTALYSKAHGVWQSQRSSLTQKRLTKLAAALLIAFAVAAIFFSAADAFTFVKQDDISVPTEQAVAYVTSQTGSNGSVLVLCPFNRFNKDMVWFYLNSRSTSRINVYQYPTMAVDAYATDFNSTQLVNYCQTNGTRYVLLYEYEGTPTYYLSTLNEQAVYGMLNSTGRFHLEATFGEAPRRMFVFSFQNNP